MNFEDRIAERVRETLEQWPMLDAAYACENCKLLFKDARRADMQCPQCASSSIFDVAALLAGRSILPPVFPAVFNDEAQHSNEVSLHEAPKVEGPEMPREPEQ